MAERAGIRAGLGGGTIIIVVVGVFREGLPIAIIVKRDCAKEQDEFQDVQVSKVLAADDAGLRVLCRARRGAD